MLTPFQAKYSHRSGEICTPYSMIDLIDPTYEHGFERRQSITNSEPGQSQYNFGGYPPGYYSSAYNAGYGSTALRGEEYRDAGIKAYQYMLDYTQSSPFGWWEGVGYPDSNSPWDIPHAAGNPPLYDKGGSCQHMWGQALNTKVLLDSLIAEKSDGTLIIGRGILKEWVAENVIEIKNVPVEGGRVGYSLTKKGNHIILEINREHGQTEHPASLELIGLKNNIVAVSDAECTYDNEKGIVTIPTGIDKVIVTTREPHSGLQKVEGKAATCTGDGIKEHYKCGECGKLFFDSEGKIEVTDSDTLVIKSAGHKFGEWTIVAETTEETERLEERGCSVCGEKEERSIPVKTPDEKPDGRPDETRDEKPDKGSEDNADEGNISDDNNTHEDVPKTGDSVSAVGIIGTVAGIVGAVGMLLIIGYRRKRYGA